MPIALWVSYTGCVKNVTSAATGLIELQFSTKAVPKFSDVGVIWGFGLDSKNGLAWRFPKTALNGDAVSARLSWPYQ